MDTNNDSPAMDDVVQELPFACQALYDLAAKFKELSSRAPHDVSLRELAAKLEQAHLEARSALLQLDSRLRAGLEFAPEVRRLAFQDFNEEQAIAGIREIEQTGGAQLKDFMAELEEASHG